jgi:hypothetical protein
MMKRYSFFVFVVIFAWGCNSPKMDMEKKQSQALAPNSGAAPVNTSTPPEVLDSPPTGDPTSVAALPTTLGVRSFDEVDKTMAALTGISGNATITNRFNALKPKLPVDNDIKSFSFSTQNAISVLAAEYCTTLINNNTYAMQRQAVIGNFDTVNSLPSVLMANANMISQNLLVKFWGTEYSTLPNSTASQSNVVTLMNDLIAGEPANSTTTRKAIIGACAAVLASSPVSSL